MRTISVVVASLLLAGACATSDGSAGESVEDGASKTVAVTTDPPGAAACRSIIDPVDAVMWMGDAYIEDPTLRAVPEEVDDFDVENLRYGLDGIRSARDDLTGAVQSTADAVLDAYAPVVAAESGAGPESAVPSDQELRDTLDALQAAMAPVCTDDDLWLPPEIRGLITKDPEDLTPEEEAVMEKYFGDDEGA